MSWLTVGKWGASALIIAFVTWAAIDRFHLAKTVHAMRVAQKRCVAAATDPTVALDACDTTIAGRLSVARSADACEAALKTGDRYAIRMTCGAQVKRVEAERAAVEASLADARAQLTDSRADRDRAVARAEARASDTIQRKAENAKTIDAAPHSADGRVRCDVECLRRLAGDAGTEGRP